MKKTKVVLAMVCAVLLVAASVMGTLAYLTSKATVTNTFTVGNVTLGGKNKAGLDEAKVDENGKFQKVTKVDDKETVTEVSTKEEATRVIANTYKLQPGHKYPKDPTIHVGDDSDDCYLFVKVENDIADIEAENETGTNGYQKIASQMAAKGWKELGTDYKNIWVYVGTEEGASAPLFVSKGADVVVFEEFKIAGSTSSDTIISHTGKQIVVTAYAVQVDGFEGKTAVEIWTAVGFTDSTDPVTPPAGGETPAGGDEDGETPVEPAE